MRTEIIVAPELRWSKDVLDYATQKGVNQYLPIIGEMTQQLIPAARRIDVFIEDDPEIADLRFIVFDVHVPAWNAQQLYETQRRWNEGLLQIYPSPRWESFVLSLQPSDSCEPKTSST
jgi:hypothetical protein